VSKALFHASRQWRAVCFLGVTPGLIAGIQWGNATGAEREIVDSHHWIAATSPAMTRRVVEGSHPSLHGRVHLSQMAEREMNHSIDTSRASEGMQSPEFWRLCAPAKCLGSLASYCGRGAYRGKVPTCGRANASLLQGVRDFFHGLADAQE